MKKLKVVVLLLIAAIFLFPSTAQTQKKANVFLLISGSLGDKGFNDSARGALDMIKQKYGANATVKYTELGTDVAKFAPALEDAGAEGYDVVFCSNNFN
jgi:basic membrane protein A